MDITIIGIVCTDVSILNGNRPEAQGCVAAGSGRTGSVFQGHLAYVRHHSVCFSIMEEVMGFGHKIGGADITELKSAMSEFRNAGYEFSYQKRNSQHFLLAARRWRLWMLSFSIQEAGSVAAAKAALAAVQSAVDALEKNGSMPLEFFVQDAGPARLTEREQQEVSDALDNVAPQDRSDLVLDASQSPAVSNIGSATRIAPGCKIYVRKTDAVLGPISLLNLQGIFQKDFPALDADPRKTKQVSLFKRLAGEAFPSTVVASYLACALSVLSPFWGDCVRLLVVVPALPLSLRFVPNVAEVDSWIVRQGEYLIMYF